MRSAEEEPDELPYILPPGPYSTIKPDFSYAAMIGQAILSSPQHRLTLQDIYEWITTVYPHYRRDEQTWMNSVRHALSTMAVFRKVPRGRAEGKSLWAIWDCDVPCFVNGGFKKSLCADMNKCDSTGKGSRKRGSMDEMLAKKSKRRKTSVSKEKDSTHAVVAPLPAMLPGGSLPPFFPSFHPNPHHQPYYQAYMPQHLPAEYIFPPLPPTSNYHHIVVNSVHASTSAAPVSRPTSVEPLEPSQLTTDEVDEANEPERGRDRSPKPLPSLSSVPSLTPNCSSSSSPPVPSDAANLDHQSPVIPEPFDLLDEEALARDEEADILGFVDVLEPSATLLPTTRDKGKDTVKSNKSTGKSRRKVCLLFTDMTVTYIFFTLHKAYVRITYAIITHSRTSG